MAKRFTDTAKWHDPWFVDLSTIDKLLWFYLIDNCNQIGIIDYSERIANFMIGSDVCIDSFINNSDNRIIKLDDGKLFIPKFISFQNGKISDKSPAHKPIIRLIESNLHILDYIKDSLCTSLLNTLIVGYQYPTSNSNSNSNSKGNLKEEVKETVYDFDSFWNDYEKKGNKKTSEQRYSKINESDRALIKEKLPLYIQSTPEKQYRKNAEVWINQECWNDEVLFLKQSNEKLPLIDLDRNETKIYMSEEEANSKRPQGAVNNGMIQHQGKLFFNPWAK